MRVIKVTLDIGREDRTKQTFHVRRVLDYSERLSATCLSGPNWVEIVWSDANKQTQILIITQL